MFEINLLRELHQLTLCEGQGNGLHLVAIDAAPNHMAMATITFFVKHDGARLAVEAKSMFDFRDGFQKCLSFDPLR